MVEKSGFVFDDVLIETFHGELRGRGARFDGSLTFHQNGVSLSFQEGDCQIKSRLPHIIRIPNKNCVLQFLFVGCGESEVSPCLSKYFAFRRDILSRNSNSR
jgi:hypothetical protein